MTQSATESLSSISSQTVDALFTKYSGKLADAKDEIGKTIFGQDDIIDQTLVTLACGGHLLLVGVPGLAKTLLVETTAKVMGLSSNRVQCTPDLMPSDILGSEILDQDAEGQRSFRFIPGPVFTQFLMADEINRASPRTQSALLQAMQEREVSIAGKTHPLPAPFHVLATQNPLEQEGTYPLPEAQLDRFLMQVDVYYPDLEAERQVVLMTTGNSAYTPTEKINSDILLEIQNFVRDMPVGEQVLDSILSLVRAARPGDDAPDFVNDYITWAPGPRASQALMMAVRAKALLDGRPAPSVDDVVDLAVPILKHRMALNYKARADNINVHDIIAKLSETL